MKWRECFWIMEIKMLQMNKIKISKMIKKIHLKIKIIKNQEEILEEKNR